MTTIKPLWPTSALIFLGMIFGSVSVYIWGSNPNIEQSEVIAKAVLIVADANQSALLRYVLEHIQDRTPAQSLAAVCKVMEADIGGMRMLKNRLQPSVGNRDLLQKLSSQVFSAEAVFQASQCGDPKLHLFTNSEADNK